MLADLTVNIEDIKTHLQEKLSKRRYEHIESVVKTAVKYAEFFRDQYDISDEDVTRIELAAWLHDICKELKGDELLQLAEHYGIEVSPEDRENPNVLHARVGAAYVEDKYEIMDVKVLAAIREHTLGSADMSPVSKIVYISDFIEPTRDPAWADQVRKIVDEEKDLDKALLKAMDLKLHYVIERGHKLHPMSIASRNALIQE